MRFRFDEEKTIAAILHICKEVRSRGESKVGFHKIFKIIYFADREHLATWGRPITGDYFVAMQYGPVPSSTYDILKSRKGDTFSIDKDKYKGLFDVHGHIVDAKADPDLNCLSESELVELNRAIEENAHLNFGDLVGKSHGPAYDAAVKDGSMCFKRIAQEAKAGADSAMLAYIRHNAANSNLFPR